jgi:hypothetical protein
MVMEIREYDSASDIAKSLEDRISESKSLLGEYLRRLDDIRVLAERSKKVRDVVFKLAGKKTGQDGLGEVSVGGLSVVLDANPSHELTAMEEVVRNQQERLLVLQRMHEALKWVDQIGDTEGLKYLVIENDGVPQRILFKVS